MMWMSFVGCRSEVEGLDVSLNLLNDDICSYLFFFFFSTIASMTATAVMLTMSRTEASQSVK